MLRALLTLRGGGGSCTRLLRDKYRDIYRTRGEKKMLFGQPMCIILLDHAELIISLSPAVWFSTCRATSTIHGCSTWLARYWLEILLSTLYWLTTLSLKHLPSELGKCIHILKNTAIMLGTKIICVCRSQAIAALFDGHFCRGGVHFSSHTNISPHRTVLWTYHVVQVCASPTLSVSVHRDGE